MTAEFGIFLPIAKGGWIVSASAPPLDGGWAQNRDAALLAEAHGLDFVMSMGKWRGFGGTTDHWGRSLESVTLTAALAPITSRIKLWATLHAILHNPVVAAKMISTLDQISGGRAGLNIVAGAYRGEFEQMGAWDEKLDHDSRYDLTEEWTRIVKRLWREPRVDFEGRYFTLRDCVCDPKPVRAPDLICAGMSERGFGFSVREADICFIGGRDRAETRAASDRARTLAAKLNKTVKVYAMCILILDETDAAAEAKAGVYQAGLDEGAVEGMLRSYGLAENGINAMVARAQGAFMTETIVGAPAGCVGKIKALLQECGLDGLMLVFDDYRHGLPLFGEKILPQLRGKMA
jgi:pyrimidine oxygenase